MEKAGKQKYADQMQAHLLAPLQMQQTIPGLGAVGYAQLATRIASPYFFNPTGPVRPGYLPPPGLKASTGLVATVEDLARYTRGLLQHQLLPDSLQKKMWQPALTLSGDSLAYGLGWFVGKVADASVYWHYGQEDCYSSVLLHLPRQKLTLLMLANTASLSDHGRMLDGNFRRSLFLWSFLRHFVIPASPPSWPEVSAPAQAWDTFLSLCPDSLRWVVREEMMARLMWHYYTEAAPKSNSLAYAHGLVKHFAPDLDSLADPALAWVWLRLLDRPAPALLPSAEKLILNTLAAQPQDPYRQYLAGWFYQIVGEKNQATPYFQAIADLPNFDLRWYKVLATYQAGENLLATQPDLARRYLQG
ncbi:MAG: beta-lactamase family protein [Microscillaceae bacterium]|nr:beta-lactamase family protein [Microscillaceae bacterium]